MCLATIAPEEYYPTASLPPSPTTQMSVDTTTVEATTTTEIEETTETTSTVDPELCTKCDINKITPRMLQNDVEYAASDEHPVDGCEQKQILCKRSDRLQCTTVQMFAVTADTSVSITELTTVSMVLANVNCDDTGKWSFKESAAGIEQITCNFEGCAPSNAG